MTVKLLFKGFNFSQDGPGNRLVYHMQGCNMHCPWCSTPESMAVNGSTLQNIEVDDVIKEIVRCAPMFFDSGGVTFTGGEPTVQFDALKELLTKAKSAKIHTAVETNGSHHALPDLFDLIDYLIIDCKHYDNTIHETNTGLGNEIVIKNITIAARQREQLLVRIPLIGSFNSSIADAEGFAHVFQNFNSDVCSFELLRYHEYGKDKWAQCGMKYTMSDAHVTDEELADFVKVFEAHHLKLIKT
jgi:pyruvate formate lyase activating enzyme